MPSIAHALAARFGPVIVASACWRRRKKLATAVRGIALDWRSAYALRFSGLTPGERAFLAPQFTPRAHYWRMPVGDGPADLATLLEIDRLNYLPDYILRKADLCTMAHGLELRAPFLDHRFVASIMGLARRRALHYAAQKSARPALAPLADLEPLTRKKRGFNPPITGWLEGNGDLAPRLQGWESG
jgi:asparagine synthase (glutamine-hydrolysing)